MRDDAQHVSLLPWPVFLHLVTSLHITMHLPSFLEILYVVPSLVVVL